MKTVYIVFAVAQLADVLTTIYALRRGAREANPVVGFFMRRLGKGWVVAKLGISVGAAAALVHYGAAWALWPFVALVLAVAVNNVMVAK